MTKPQISRYVWKAVKLNRGKSRYIKSLKKPLKKPLNQVAEKAAKQTKSFIARPRWIAKLPRGSVVNCGPAHFCGEKNRTAWFLVFDGCELFWESSSSYLNISSEPRRLPSYSTPCSSFKEHFYSSFAEKKSDRSTYSVFNGCDYFRYAVRLAWTLLPSRVTGLSCGGTPSPFWMRCFLAVQGGRTPPTQFFVDGCYARLLLLYTYRSFSTATQRQSTCRRSR